jgi:nitroreductase
MPAKFTHRIFCAVENFEGLHRQRQVACARSLYNAMGIARLDKAARWTALRRNYGFFDAPQEAFVSMDRRFGHNNTLDVGIYVQNLVLAIHAAGLGSCVQGALAHHVPIVRKWVGMGDE